MAAQSPPEASMLHQAVSIVRLHGEACFYCGAALGKLTPAGTITTPASGGVREWQIVACADHRRER